MTSASLYRSTPAAPARTACYHCGLPVLEADPPHVHAEGADQPVCCHGCAAAVLFLQNAGLDDYYHLREAPPLTRPGTHAGATGEASPWSDPAVARRYVTRVADEDRASLALDGVRCAACAWVLEQGLTSMSGVAAARVNVASARLELAWDPEATDLGALMARVVALGFDAVPARSDAETRLHERQRRRSLRALGIAGVAAMQVMMLAVADYGGAFAQIEPAHRALLLWAQMVLTTVTVAYGARTFFAGAANALRGRRLTMDVPVALAIGLGWTASVLALLGGSAESLATRHVYFDSVAMFTFLLLLGRHLELTVRHRFAKADAALESLLPPIAHRLDRESGGTLVDVVTDALEPGDRVRVRPGEVIPADGRVLGGVSRLDRSALTGESEPVMAASGTAVTAGARNLDGVVDVEVLRAPGESAVAGIPALLDQARRGRSRLLRLADRAAAGFLALVLTACATAALVWLRVEPSRALEVVLATLIVTCPCALSLAAPTALTAAGVALRRAGVLLVDPDVLERVARCTRVAFDKTGTLTVPEDDALACRPALGIDRSEALTIAAALERDVDHPLATAVRRAAECEGLTDLPRAEDVRMVTGQGVEGTIAGTRHRLGRPSFVGADGAGIVLARREEDGWRELGRLRGAETLRSAAAATVAALVDLGLRPALISGDEAERVDAAADALNIDERLAGATPEDKLRWLETAEADGEHVLYVGDGINDAPSLGGASASLAVGGATDYARTAADAVLVTPTLEGVEHLVETARRVRRRIRANLGWAVAYNLAALPLAMSGQLTPWMAAIGMSASSLLVLANSARLLRAPRRTAWT